MPSKPSYGPTNKNPLLILRRDVVNRYVAIIPSSSMIEDTNFTHRISYATKGKELIARDNAKHHVENIPMRYCDSLNMLKDANSHKHWTTIVIAKIGRIFDRLTLPNYQNNPCWQKADMVQLS